MKPITLTYGMSIKEMPTGAIFELSKYWEDDTDANAFKVKLGNQSFYSSDLKDMIRNGEFKIV